MVPRDVVAGQEVTRGRVSAQRGEGVAGGVRP